MSEHQEAENPATWKCPTCGHRGVPIPERALGVCTLTSCVTLRHNSAREEPPIGVSEDGRVVFADGWVGKREPEPERPWGLLNLTLGRRLMEWDVNPFAGETTITLKFEDGYELRVAYSEGWSEFVHPEANEPIEID